MNEREKSAVKKLRAQFEASRDLISRKLLGELLELVEPGLSVMIKRLEGFGVIAFEEMRAGSSRIVTSQGYRVSPHVIELDQELALEPDRFDRAMTWLKTHRAIVTIALVLLAASWAVKFANDVLAKFAIRPH